MNGESWDEIDRLTSDPLLRYVDGVVRLAVAQVLRVDAEAGLRCHEALLALCREREAGDNGQWVPADVLPMKRSEVREIRPGVIELDGDLRIRFADDDELEEVA